MYNTNMIISDLMKEYSIEINDIRWFLANNLTLTILELAKEQNKLSIYIESGKLEVDLYNMEDNYLEELQDLSDRNKIDDVNVREIFNSIVMLKRKRK